MVAGSWTPHEPSNVQRRRTVSTPGTYYLVTRHGCTGPDFADRGAQRVCKQVLAVQLHCECIASERRTATARRYDQIFGMEDR